MNSNSFNNKKSLSQQDGCDDHTRREKPARAYNSNTMPQALPAGVALKGHSLVTRTWAAYGWMGLETQ